MRKRSPLVLLSSSSEEDEARGCASVRSRSSSRPMSRSASTARKRPRARGSKKGSSSASRAVRTTDFDLLSEEFCEHLHNVSIRKGTRLREENELWTEKHKPHSLAELAVHKKKVEEVKRWMEERMNTEKEGIRNYVLLITGQSGVGKSTAIDVIASLLGADLCEWTTPTPTLWGDAADFTTYNTFAVLDLTNVQYIWTSVFVGVQYTSKLNEFESFVETIRKYSLLLPACIEESRKPIIILIDDIPVTNGRIAFTRLKKCFKTLIQSAQVPTVILISKYHKIESSDCATEYWEELESSIEQSGAFKIAFNPITENSIKKRLTIICQEEKYDIPPHYIDHIARVSGGDIRHAIMSLQYCCLKIVESFAIHASTPILSLSEPDSSSQAFLSTSCSTNGKVNPQTSMLCGRDEKITLFHALGKFLHNKRETQVGFALDSFALKEKFERNPMKMDAPEEVISQAHGQPQTITDFLHENVLDFLSDEAIENAWLVTSYLGDADYILASILHPSFRQKTETYGLDNMRQMIAASVAVRGVLFGNSHPSPSRWHTIRSPTLWQLEQVVRRNKVQMLPERYETYNSSSFCSVATIATEYRPTNNWLYLQTSDNVYVHDKHLENFNSEDNKNCIDEKFGCKSGGSEEDDIEDW